MCLLCHRAYICPAHFCLTRDPCVSRSNCIADRPYADLLSVKLHVFRKEKKLSGVTVLDDCGLGYCWSIPLTNDNGEYEIFRWLSPWRNYRDYRISRVIRISMNFRSVFPRIGIPRTRTGFACSSSSSEPVERAIFCRAWNKELTRIASHSRSFSR